MKKYISIFLLLIAAISFNSCKEDLDLVGNFEETAIVYGLLDKADSVHMIKINRAFIGPGNSLEIAGIADSNYFQSVVATIKEYVGSNLLRTWVLEDTIVTNKDESGIFYAPEQKLYYFATSPSAPLLDNATYKLHIDINNGAFEVTSETGIVSGVASTIDGTYASMRLAENPGVYRNTAISVQTGNSYQVNTTLVTNYRDWIGSNYTDKSFNWTLGETEVTPNTTFTFNATGETFYNLMRTSCQSGNAAVDRRTLTSFDVVITAGAEELYNYILVNKPSSSLAQSKPTYTNLEATNGKSVIGIFSSRQTLRINKPFIIVSSPNVRGLDKKSTQELCIGGITGPFLFCSDHPADNIVGMEEPYACN